jgi:hypothetical protein
LWSGPLTASGLLRANFPPEICVRRAGLTVAYPAARRPLYEWRWCGRIIGMWPTADVGCAEQGHAMTEAAEIVQNPRGQRRLSIRVGPKARSSAGERSLPPLTKGETNDFKAANGVKTVCKSLAPGDNDEKRPAAATGQGDTGNPGLLKETQRNGPKISVILTPNRTYGKTRRRGQQRTLDPPHKNLRNLRCSHVRPCHQAAGKHGARMVSPCFITTYMLT